MYNKQNIILINLFIKISIKKLNLKKILFYSSLVSGCLLNIIVLINTNLYVPFFLTFFLEYINLLYPVNANLIVSITTFNEIYELELIIIFICILSKYFFLFFFFLFFFLKTNLYINEYLRSIILFSFYWCIKIFFFFFLLTFPFFISIQVSNIFKLLVTETFILTFNLNILNEINNFLLWFSILLLIYLNLKNRLTFLIIIYPYFIFFFLFYFFLVSVKNKTQEKEAGFEPTINCRLY